MRRQPRAASWVVTAVWAAGESMEHWFSLFSLSSKLGSSVLAPNLNVKNYI